MLFFLAFYSSKNPEQNVTGSKNIKQQKLFPTLVINQYIRMISEGSYDSEVTADEISDLHYWIKLYFK